MGRKFSWETEVIGHDPDRLLDMRFIEGPMKGGGVTYRIEPEGGGSRVSIRNSGPGPQIMGWFVRRWHVSRSRNVTSRGRRFSAHC